MNIGTLDSLYRYPVKSMAGESLSRLPIGQNGIPGDRAWAVRDEERGGIRGGKRFAALMSCRATYLEEPVTEGASPALITLPSGDTIMTGHPDVAGRLSAVVGSPVTLWPLMPAEALDHYRRGAPLLDDMEAELRRVFARLPNEPLPDLSVFPPELAEFESPLGTYFDAFPLLVMTRQSLATMQTVNAASQWDVRRFRPNLVLDCPETSGLPESEWAGRKLRVGSALLQMEAACPRCVMTTHGFDDVPSDPGVMRSLVKEADGCLGVYASILEPGEVSLGDQAILID